MGHAILSGSSSQALDQTGRQLGAHTSALTVHAQIREFTLDAEISRELVPLRNGYRHIGQKARLRLSSGLDYDVAGSRGPPASGMQAHVLCTVS